ncbi:MAG: TRAP transporter substrate-binding protein [Ectothiorhodospiraceae bacterium]|nr:TRAP transporter substrate-binding protein [Chromatiales bacterium]MCP5154805.1 TRAP transporter substrate-binding protein [Ectothiorhodospiraceae bacterium]
MSKRAFRSRTWLAVGSIVALAATLPVAATAQSFKMKVGVSTPPSYSYNIGLAEFARIVKEGTGGDVDVSIFPSAQLGSEVEMGKNVQLGTLEGTVISTSNISPFHKPLQILSVPYLLKNLECGLHVVDGPIGDEFAAALLEKAKIRVLGWYTFGTRQLFNTKRDVVRLADLKGLKIRVPPDRYLEMTWRTLGAQPVPLPFPELFSALQQGVVDGDANPISSIQQFKWYEVVKHVSMANVAAGISPFLVNERFFQKLPKAHQEVLLYAAKVSTATNRRAHAESTAAARKFLETEGGVKFVVPDLDEFRGAMGPVLGAAGEEFGSELVERIRRAQNGC